MHQNVQFIYSNKECKEVEFTRLTMFFHSTGFDFNGKCFGAKFNQTYRFFKVLVPNTQKIQVRRGTFSLH